MKIIIVFAVSFMLAVTPVLADGGQIPDGRVPNSRRSQSFFFCARGCLRFADSHGFILLYNCLVLISDYARELYEDKWYRDVFNQLNTITFPASDSLYPHLSFQA